MSVLTQRYETVPVGQLRPHPDNPRRGNLATIGKSIATNGFYGAVVAQRSTGHVLAGNHRLQAAQAAGIAEIPVVWVDVDDERAKRILLADNRTSDLATNDQADLLALLDSLAVSPDLLDGTGFHMDDLDDLRVALGDVTRDDPAPTQAHYAETPEQEQARAATRGNEPSIHVAGLRELVLVYPNDEHAALVDLINQLRPATGQAEATTSQVVAAALRVAAGHPGELAATG